jgi:hypothetical protein
MECLGLEPGSSGRVSCLSCAGLWVLFPEPPRGKNKGKNVYMECL